MTARLLLVRHGETVWHADNRYAGSSDVALTDRGVCQAEALARRLAQSADRPVALYSSPLSRARNTAAPVATALGRTVEVLADLREAHFGIAEGRTLAELPDEVAERFRADPVDGVFPEAETPANVAERGVAALRWIAERAESNSDEGPVLVIAHNTLLRVTLCRLLGIPLPTYRRVLPKLDNTAITEIDVDAGHASLRRLNAPVE